MAERLTDLQMLKFVEIYQEYECLWNTCSDLYRNRDARESAYTEISERLNIPGIMPKDIPKKISNMRSSYYKEMKRIEKSIRSGASSDSVYRPKVSWFATADGFLRSFRNEQQDTFSNDNDSSHWTTNDVPNIQNTDSLADTEVNSNAADENSDESDQNETRTRLKAPSRKRARTKHDKKQDDIHKAIDKIDKIAKTITNNANLLIHNREDKYDYFGKYVAMTLRSLPSELAIIGTTAVQKTLSEIQLGALRENAESAMLSYGASTSNSYDPQNPRLLEEFKREPTPDSDL